MVVTRSDFEDLTEAGIHHSVSYVRQMIDEMAEAIERGRKAGEP